ncbi:MAG: spermine synthase, partial [Magnetococcales bacterium]|nr:spermine synthase [Magnetococcales bacterium]
MRTLYRRQHRGCMVEVLESDDSRILNFDSHLTQSRMLLADPLTLALAYTRCMMAGLLFLPGILLDPPFRVLMIGLGGGSMAKFLLHHFAGCRMDVVEADGAMPAVARDFFYLPEEPRLTLHVEDGVHFLEREAVAGGRGGYDLILVDAFDRNGMAQSVYGERFFARLHASLTPRGVAAINLIRSEGALFRGCAEIIAARFQGRVVG